MESLILWLFYLLLGCIVSIPYTFLSKGGFEVFVRMLVFGPIIALSLFVLYGMRRGVSSRGKKLWKGGTSVFWGATVWFCSPIILNGVSLLLKWMGAKMISGVIFKARFWILWGLPALIVLYIIIFYIAYGVIKGMRELRERFSRKTTPPSSSPPSDPGVNGRRTVHPHERDSRTEQSTFQVTIA